MKGVDVGKLRRSIGPVIPGSVIRQAVTGGNLGVGLWRGQGLSLLFVGVVPGPLFGCVVVAFVLGGVVNGTDRRLENVVDSHVVLVVWCVVLGHLCKDFVPQLYGGVVVDGVGAGFDRWAGRVGLSSGFVAKLIGWVACCFVGLRSGGVPVVFGLL